ncbi:MO25-like protein [Pyrus ussuriensis x Pyrus communis]|uniref:MO25-like protein n=1 Tax=Pyrus ussuriensis x Pyrus communis TaxID=2448454 RepID=A0A5N5HA18_9ROSA|nr:MO25-like protein [Pyrus ussuriensis x Pyrus communis]
MKALFKPKARMPIELVKHMRELLIFIDQNTNAHEQKRKEKIRTVVYGDDDSEPNKDSCAQLTREFFREDTFRLLIVCLSKLNLGDRQNATHVIANLQRQKVQWRIIALEYLENNIDIMDILIKDSSDIALSYGAITRECIRHQNIARSFFYYIQTPNFDIASDAAATFKIRSISNTYRILMNGHCYELMTRHKSTVAEFLSKNYEWYNSQLLESPNYITKRQAIKDPKKTIKLETFQVFKLFVANQNKPPEIVNVLVKNRTKLIRFFNDFTIEKEDEQFEANKAQVINEISVLKLKRSNPKSSVFSFRTNCAIQC